MGIVTTCAGLGARQAGAAAYQHVPPCLSGIGGAALPSMLVAVGGACEKLLEPACKSGPAKSPKSSKVRLEAVKRSGEPVVRQQQTTFLLIGADVIHVSSSELVIPASPASPASLALPSSPPSFNVTSPAHSARC